MARTPLRRDLLLSLYLIFAVATMVVALALAIVLPLAESAVGAVSFVFVLTATQLIVLGLFGGWIVKRSLLDPVDTLVHDVQKIANGDYEHRIETPKALELDRIRNSVNIMADRLIRDQEQLARNVESLEETNRQLVEARNQVIQSARLASVGTLAAGIAHEVGNPLGAIMGYVDVAESRGQARGEDTEVVEAIREEAHRIDRIVRGLLDYARPKGDELRPASPRHTVERVRELLDSQGRFHRVSTRWSIAEDLPDVLIHEQHLEQVLVNLLLNAVDALDGVADPSLTVRVEVEDGPAARFPARREGDNPHVNYMHRRRVASDDDAEAVATLKTAEQIVVVSVTDNGPGLSEEVLEHIFDPFFTTKDPGKGTGLGLFISSRLIEGMGGRIEAENAPEGGARFLLRFPEAILGAGPNHNEKEEE